MTRFFFIFLEVNFGRENFEKNIINKLSTKFLAEGSIVMIAYQTLIFEYNFPTKKFLPIFSLKFFPKTGRTRSFVRSGHAGQCDST